jgi:acetyl-CoA carboxylase beta subunit
VGFLVATKREVGGGGVTIADSAVNTGGGDIVGRDKVQYASVLLNEGIFQPIAQAIEAADPTRRAAATEKLKALKEETAKGENADDTIIAKLVEGLVGLVPSALSAVVSAFTSPILGSMIGPVTKYVLDKIQDK